MANRSVENSASAATLEVVASAADSAETAGVVLVTGAEEDDAVLPQADRVRRRHSPREMDFVWCKRIPSFRVN